MLWLESEDGIVQTEGERGLFTLPSPAEIVTLRWGGAEGAALARLRWRPDSLEWDGGVRLGGYIDLMHIETLPLMDDEDEERAVVVLSVGGQPLLPGVEPYPTAAMRRSLPYPFPGFRENLAEEIGETVSTWLALDSSPALVLAQDALVSKLRVFCFGHLAEEVGGWQRRFALPLLLEGMTLFAP